MNVLTKLDQTGNIKFKMKTIQVKLALLAYVSTHNEIVFFWNGFQFYYQHLSWN